MKIDTLLKNTFRLVLAFVIAATAFGLKTPGALAWEQGVNGSHEEINKNAVNRFLSSSVNNPKYANSPIDTKQTFWGNQTISATLNATEFSMQENTLTFEQWVTHGGFSADEPEIWACVRHFYDPLAVNGVPQLTDHLALHGFVYTTISARDWAFSEPGNPYSWRKALEYYKQAMELSDDAQITVVKGMDFRDTDILVNSAEDARSVYLGKAFRALGETMHMMADITQPSHVRNDSHPSIDTDPLESYVNKDTVRLVKDGPVDPFIGNAIDSVPGMVQMYDKIADLTNANFYTDDTIYDKASGVKPRNWENPYPSPQFSDMTLDKGSSLKTYSQSWNGKQVRMVQQTYTSWKLGALWQDYVVPPSFATEQAEVLIPIAIKANTKVISYFFPTFELSLNLKQNLSASTNGDANYREYALETQLKHLVNDDVEWQKNNLAIKYTGPAELWGETKGKARKIADFKFKEGLPLTPQTVYMGDEKYKNADKHLISNSDKIYIMIKAGGRNITSKKIAIPVQLYINPLTLNGEMNKEYTFTAKTDQVVENARFDWFIDGVQKKSSTVPSITVAFTAEGNHSVSVKLFDGTGKEVRSAQSAVSIEAEFTEPPALSVTPSVSSTPTISATGNNNLSTLQKRSLVTANLNSSGVFKKGPPGEEVTQTIRTDAGITGTKITWSGTSFSGTVNLSSQSGSGADTFQNTYTDEINGTVSADGSTLLSLTFTHKDTQHGGGGYGDSSADYTVYTKKLQLQNVPVNGNGKFSASGADSKSYIVTVEDKTTSFKKGSVCYTRTRVSTDWTATPAPMLTISFN